MVVLVMVYENFSAYDSGVSGWVDDDDVDDVVLVILR